MRKVTLLLVLLSHFLYAQLSIQDDTINITNFTMEKFIDKSGTVSFSEVQDKPFVACSNKMAFGKHSPHIWVRFELHNDTNTTKELFIHNTLAYLFQETNFYIVQNKTLVSEELFDLNTQEGAKKMYGTDAIVSFTIEANQSKTVYMKSRSLIHHYFSLNVYDDFHSKVALGKQHFYTILILGFLSAMAFYNLILFSSTRYKANLYYFLYIATAVIWLSYAYGILGQMFGIYGKAYYGFHSFIMLMPVFLSLFVKAVFETKQHYPTENKFLDSVWILFLSTTILSMFNTFTALEITTWLYTYLGVVLIFLTISLYKKGNPLAKYFLIGHIFFMIFDVVAVMFFEGFIVFNYVTSHAVGIGISIESVLLAYIISYRIKLLQEKEQNLLNTLDAKVETRTKALRKVNQQYEVSLVEKESLLKEIHHRVKNNMQVISSLLGLQSMESGDEKVQKVLKESENRIRSMMLVHEELYSSDSLTYINAKSYITRLYNELYDSYKTPELYVTCTVETKEVTLTADTSVYIGLILSELITNSFKYAFKGKDEGHVLIQLYMKEHKTVLRVKDDGIGFNHEKRKGAFGTELIELLATKQLKGTCVQSGDDGVCTVIEFTQ